MVFEFENAFSGRDDQFSEPVMLPENQVAFVEDHGIICIRIRLWRFLVLLRSGF